jgi:hypothetical protein
MSHSATEKRDRANPRGIGECPPQFAEGVPNTTFLLLSQTRVPLRRYTDLTA